MKSNTRLRKLFFAPDLSDELIERLSLERFEYFNTKLDNNLIFIFGDQLERSRILLRNRSGHEIKDGLDSLKWMLKSMDYSFKDEDIEYMRNTYKSLKTSETMALRKIQSEFDISKLSNFKNAQWYEFFALLSLSNIIYTYYWNQAKVIDVHAIKKEIDRDIAQLIFESKDNIFNSLALEAMDSIGHAEGLYDAYILNKKFKQEKTSRAREGGKSKNRPSNLLKEDVIELYKELVIKKPKISALAAAKIIYKELQKRIDATLSTEEPVKRIEIWIGQYKKKLRLAKENEVS